MVTNGEALTACKSARQKYQSVFLVVGKDRKRRGSTGSAGDIFNAGPARENDVCVIDGRRIRDIVVTKLSVTFVAAE